MARHVRADIRRLFARADTGLQDWLASGAVDDLRSASVKVRGSYPSYRCAESGRTWNCSTVSGTGTDRVSGSRRVVRCPRSWRVRVANDAL